MRGSPSACARSTRTTRPRPGCLPASTTDFRAVFVRMPAEEIVELIDIGANLTNKAFHDDLDDVIRRAQDAGVSTIVVTGTSLDASERALELASGRAPTLYATAGVHPHDAKTFTPTTATRLTALAA